MSSPAEWPQIEAALDEILALPETQWAAACARIAGPDTKLRREIESLLAYTQGIDPLFDRPLTRGIDAQFDEASLGAGTLVGAYRILELIGRGGMGEVYKAERADGQFEQIVALKLIQRDAAEHLIRFQSERQILARLEHPGIARLLDGGLTADGRPYMAMELIVGRPIIDWCREQRCDLAARLELFLAICDAVAYAHRNLVVHRDLKPANVLATSAGKIKLLDFGVAKLVGVPRGDETQTAPLTPSYAAPEQLARGSVTTATDVYALGLILFELLSGARPWRLAQLPLVAALEKVMRDVPPLVSQAAGSNPDAPVSAALLRGDLDSIVAKTLRKEPEHRYDSVSALQADIKRSLRSEPVAARTGARLYVAGRFVRRHRFLLASAALLTLALLGGLVGTMWQARRATHEAAQARQAQTRLLTQVAAAEFKEGDLSGAQAIILEVLADRETAPSDSAAAIGIFQEIRAASSQLAILSGHEGWVWQATYSPDGKRILTASEDGTARQWDSRTGAQLAVIAGHEGRIYSAVYSADGKKILTGSGDKTARVWDAQSGVQLLILEGHEDLVASAAFSPDQTRIATASRDKTWRLWDASSGAALAIGKGHTDSVRSVVFSPDGTRVLTASNDKSARIWDARSAASLIVLKGHEGNLQGAVYSPDGARIATSSADSTARIWDARSGAQLTVLSGHTDVVHGAAYSPDGFSLVTASADKSARVWDARTGSLLAILSGHGDIVLSANYSPDGATIVTASADTLAAIWDARKGAPLALLSGYGSAVLSAAYSPDGRRIVTTTYDNTARISDASTHETLAVLNGHTGSVRSAAFSADSSRLITTSIDRTARIWDANSGKSLLVLAGHGDTVTRAAFSPDAARVVTASYDKTARVWDARTGEALGVLAHDNVVGSAGFSPDGTRIITASEDKAARLWDTGGTAPPAVMLHGDVVESAGFSPDGKRIVSTSDDKTARVWDANSHRQLLALLGHRDSVNSAAYSSDGRLLVTASDDKTARIWDALSGEELGVLGSHPNHVLTISFSPDNERVVTASMDPLARIWDARAPAPLAAQISWARAAQFAVLSDAERTQLGLAPRATVQKRTRSSVHCDRDGAGEPHALAQMARRDELQALLANDPTQRQGLLMQAFSEYAKSAECADREGWPDEASKQWRYRRASLARMLARDGQMQAVADHFAEVVGPSK